MSQVPKFENLVDLVERSVKEFSSRQLFGTKANGGWKWITYREFGQKIDELRGGLAALGVGEGDRVAIISNNRPEWAVAAYATFGLGGAYVPMYEAQLDKEWLYILKDCGAKVVICPNSKFAERLDALRKDLPELQHIVTLADRTKIATMYEEVLSKGRVAPKSASRPSSEHIACLIYTSGTTGNPKGVKLSHGNIGTNVSAIHEVFPMSPEDRSLSFLPWAHSFGQTVELHALISMGASMGIAESVEKIIENLAEVQPTLLFSVPRIFNRIYDNLQKKMAAETPLKRKLMQAAFANAEKRRRGLESGKTDGATELKHRVFDKLVFSKVRARFGGRLKYAFSGGAAISKEVAEFIDNLGITVYEGYGLTETSPIATANWPGARRLGTVGKPIPGVTIAIDRTDTQDPKQGEIVVHGPNVMKGYHNLPEEDAKVFTADGGFRTGDMGFVDEDGFLHITGRIKEQYKLENGKYVAPAPLEEYLKLSPFISNIMIYGDNKPYNTAVIVPDFESVKKWAADLGIASSDNGKLASEPKVQELIASEIEKHSGEFKQFEKIRRFVLVAEDFSTQNDMLTPTLKVKRRMVLKAYSESLLKLYS